MKRILGLDTGTNSLGWAVVDKDTDGTYVLVRKGSLIFQEGVKIEKGIESSKAADRTAHRALRKQYFRRRLRKIEVLKVLVRYNFCPALSDEQLHEWHVHKIYPLTDEFMDWQRTSDNDSKNPYYYRHLCLHEELDLDNEADRYILGRCFYHLAQRRGFLSNRLDASDDSDPSGAVKKGISDLGDEMKTAGCEYLGDYFYTLYNSEKPVRIRSRYTDREEHYKTEFYAICNMQKLPDEMVTALERALYFQRPLKSQRQGVGKCTMEKGKPRCAESHPDYEEFRMWSLINNIKVKGPHDVELRNLNDEEIAKALPMFFRKSKPNFDFEDVAKAIAGKGKYQNIKEVGDLPYKFNYRMTQSMAGCPTIAQLRNIFGDDWKTGIAESFTLNTKADGTLKTMDEMVNDVWNVLYSFSSNDKLKDFAQTKLQLDDDRATEFSKIRLAKGFASLSLRAVRKILPFLKSGMIYSHAVTLANIPTIIGKATWERDKAELYPELSEYVSNFNASDEGMQGTLDFCIKDIIRNRYDLKPGAADKLYHPSMIETYPDAKMKDGVYQLGSPRTNAIRNPMAMRSLHQLRKVINQLLKEGVIDHKTEVHIEYARELNDANMRTAIAAYDRNREKDRKDYVDKIVKLYKEETGKDITPTADDILKYQLWEEQGHVCLYTGEQIGIKDFIDPNPKCDIEHTIPRSVGGDFTQMNLTLCNSIFNRMVKRAQIPSQLANYDEILERISSWKDKCEELTKDIDRLKRKSRSCSTKEQKDRVIQDRHQKELERDYWKGKYQRFTMTEVPEGFARRQGAGIGLVSKYAGLYLKSLFHEPNNRQHSNVFVVKGSATAEFRKMWGIQNAYEKKSRDNHVHHCIDAITIACIGLNEYNQLAKYYHQDEECRNGHGNKPQFAQPWPTFAEDMKNLEKEMIVVHSTPDNMPKHAKKKIKGFEGRYAQGDSARGSLHMDTYYGAIERDGDVRYVVRRPLDSFENIKDLDNIVDDAVRDAILRQVEGHTFKEAIKGKIYMNEKKGILIKKVRCYANDVKSPLNIRHHRDESSKDYKQQVHVKNDVNYMMVVYEGMKNNRIKRKFEIINNLTAANSFRQSCGTGGSNIPDMLDDLPLKAILKQGTQVLLMQEGERSLDLRNIPDLTDRLYHVVTMEMDGRIQLRHHQEARTSKEISSLKTSTPFKKGDDYRPLIRISLSNFNALIENIDFTIDCLGQIHLK